MKNKDKNIDPKDDKTIKIDGNINHYLANRQRPGTHQVRIGEQRLNRFLVKNIRREENGLPPLEPSCIDEMTVEQYSRKLDEVILSMDEAKIRDFMAFAGMPEVSSESFWPTVHKSITARRNLPIEFRKMSKAWLDDLGLSSHDDGDLGEEKPGKPE